MYQEGQASYPIPTAQGDMAAKQRRLDITLRQNIDEQIKMVEDQLSTLKETKARLEASNLLDVRIDDIQRAMRW